MTARGNQGLAQHAADFVRAVPDELVTRQELAARMRVSLATVDRNIRDGMPTIRFSPGSVRIRPRDAVAWAEDRYGKQGKAA